MNSINISTNTLVCHVIDNRENKYPALTISDFLFNKYGNTVLLHCDNGPAFSSCGRSIWYQNGKIHRIDGPAIIDYNLKIEHYYLYGKEIYPQELFFKMVKLMRFL